MIVKLLVKLVMGSVSVFWRCAELPSESLLRRCKVDESVQVFGRRHNIGVGQSTEVEGWHGEFLNCGCDVLQRQACEFECMGYVGIVER